MRKLADDRRPFEDDVDIVQIEPELSATTVHLFVTRGVTLACENVVVSNESQNSS
jgi:hypothetical protein